MIGPGQRAINLSRVGRCDQVWAAMPAVAGGRQCRQCQKRIVDFTRMTPAEVARVHMSSSAPVCGRYTPEQLNGTGQQPAWSGPWHRSPVVMSLVSMLLTEPAETTAAVAQTIERYAVPETARNMVDPVVTDVEPADSLLLRGRVVERVGKILQGVPFVNVRVMGAEIIVASDIDGRFVLDLSPLEGRTDSVTLEVLYIGHTRQQRRVPVQGTDELIFDLTGTEIPEIVYAVEFKRPPLYKRVWWGIKGFFRRNE